jgi:hypothetical protein
MYAEDPILRHSYKEGPPGRPKGRAKARTTKDQHQGPPVSQPKEGRAGGGPPGVGRTPDLVWPNPDGFPSRCTLMWSAPTLLQGCG